MVDMVVVFFIKLNCVFACAHIGKCICMRLQACLYHSLYMCVSWGIASNTRLWRLIKTEPLFLPPPFLPAVCARLDDPRASGDSLVPTPPPPIFLQDSCRYSCVLQIYPLRGFWRFELRSSSFDDKHFYPLNHHPSACLSILDDEKASVTVTHAYLATRGVLTHSDILVPFSISIWVDGLLKLIWLRIHLNQ